LADNLIVRRFIAVAPYVGRENQWRLAISHMENAARRYVISVYVGAVDKGLATEVAERERPHAIEVPLRFKVNSHWPKRIMTSGCDAICNAPNLDQNK
jgi:hypothetical protein